MLDTRHKTQDTRHKTQDTRDFSNNEERNQKTAPRQILINN